MKPGDILTHTDNFDVTRRWRVCGVYLGGEGQESVVEIVSISDAGPSADGFAVRMYVPEILLRDLARTDVDDSIVAANFPAVQEYK